MKKSIFWISTVVSVVAVAVLLVSAGCEGETNAGALTVTPGDVALSGSSNCVTLVATVPTNSVAREFSGTGLEWTVSDSSLGSIVAASGNQAFYCRTALGGNNLVVVRDVYGAEGWATIHQ